MHPFDTDEDFSDEDTDSNKRKHSQDFGPMKKVKYEDITEKPNKKSNLYKPPTVEELNELKETQNLYNNNLFRLQIEELIKEVNIKNKHKKTFIAWYESFKKFLDELPEHNIFLSEIKLKKKTLSEADVFINAIVNDDYKTDQDFNVKFMKPESFELFGLNSINALPGPNLIVNINLKMPRNCFNVKDYLNNRYFVKRYYYLAFIAYYLKEKKIGGLISWSFHNHNNLLPIIQIKLNEKITVNLYATPTENYFKASRCSADINNIKLNIFNTGSITETSTVLYNSCLGHDVTLTLNHTFINKNLSELSNAQEAIKLIWVWLNQRQLNVGVGSFTEDLILFFIIYLLSKKKINKHMSSYQIIRNFWGFINETDLTQNPIALSEDVKAETLDNFRNNFDVVFLDLTGFYNVVAFLNVDVYSKIKRECGIAFRLLDFGGINAFHCLFITKLPIELQYDLILNIKTDSVDNIIQKMSDDERTKFLGFADLFTIKYVSQILKQGFNKRASLITPIVNDKTRLSFGINLDPRQAFSIIERGPALNDPKEKEFKKFWGKLCTDRRFKDGSVCVAVYFETETARDRRGIIKTIVDWVVSQKLKLEYSLHYNDFENLIVERKLKASYPMGTNEEATLKVLAASDDLAKKLRGLEMPLAITGVQGISDVFCMTEVFPPISTSYKYGNKVTTVLEDCIGFNSGKIGVVPRFVMPVECVLQLEHSSKWPKDLTTIRHMKTAFYIEISKILSKKFKIISSVKPDFLDVLYEGFVFRYRVYLSREVGLLKKESTNNGITVYKDTPQSREMELRLNILPKVIGALKGLQSQHPSFGPATALIKRWLRSQLLDDYHFPDHVINLLSASLYLNQSAFEVAGTPQIGFLRFLKFLSELQWNIQPVIVNFNDEITKDAIADIDSKLLQNRDAYPNLFIATPFDNCESIFTKFSPTKEVLRRVKQLATETLSHVFHIMSDESLITVRNLFIPNLDGYDVIIHLRPLLNPVRHQQVAVDDTEGLSVLKPFDPNECTKIPVTAFNPVQLYLKELRENYGEFANFFHDSYGGNVIGILWIPKALESRDFKVSNVSGRKLEDGKLVLNVEAIIEDFYIYGKGIVKTIDKRK